MFDSNERKHSFVVQVIALLPKAVTRLAAVSMASSTDCTENKLKGYESLVCGAHQSKLAIEEINES